MQILTLTILLSLVLAGFFCLLFVCNQGNAHLRSPERDALLPFNDEVTPNKPTPSGKHSE